MVQQLRIGFFDYSIKEKVSRNDLLAKLVVKNYLSTDLLAKSSETSVKIMYILICKAAAAVFTLV